VSEQKHYGLKFLPSHLSEADSAEKLRALLLDVRFLQAKIASSGTQSLIDDYDLPAGSSVLDREGHSWSSTFQNTLRKAADSLDRDSTQLAPLIRALIPTPRPEEIEALLSQAAKLDRQRAQQVGGSVPSGQAAARSRPVLGEPAPLLASPPRPRLFVGRDGVLNDLEARLGIGERLVRPVTVVRGWPGVGKTTVINVLASDPRILAAFPDGVFWTPLGDRGSPYPVLAAWGQRLGLPAAEPRPGLAELIGLLRTLFASRRCLFVIDDVWQSDAAIPFKQILGPQCALLLSTRFSEVARELADEPEDIYVLPILAEAEALDLLARTAPHVVRELPAECRGLVRDLECLPLALRVAGRLLASEFELGIDTRPLLEEIRSSHILLDAVAPDDRFDPQTGTTPTVSLLLLLSTDRLDPLSRDRFAMLGVFAPKPASFDLSDLRAVWEIQDPLPSLRRLVDHGLLEPVPAAGRFQMHALLVKHASMLLEAGD
jgi:hypothetical protein